MSDSFSVEKEMFSSLDESIDGLAKDATYGSKKAMKLAVAVYNLKYRAGFQLYRSKKCRWYMKCKGKSPCEFIFRSTGWDDIWRCTNFVGHTCIKDLNRVGTETVSSMLLRTLYANRQMKKCMSMSHSLIIKDLKTRYDISILYDHALSVKKWVTNLMYGDDSESFKLLLAYLRALGRENPGSHVALRTSDGDHVFQNVFVVLSASIS